MTKQNNFSPLFLFSLPRSGSTLVQRVLASHPDIATTSEPWVLLPFIYALKEQGSVSEYGYHAMASAMNDFCKEFPNGKEDYYAEVRNLVMALYKKSDKQDCRYFLDKTPRYNLILEEIFEIFQDSKMIFLWRHPLAVTASIMETWAEGHWNIYRHEIDLYTGLENMINVSQKTKIPIYRVKYEDLITGSEKLWKEIFDYLDLEFDPEIIHKFSKVSLKGRLGDPTGVKQYQALSTEPLNKWKKTFCNPIRKAWAKRYINWIGKERLAYMGYDYDEILKDIKSIPFSTSYLVSDVKRLCYGIIYTSGRKYLFEKLNTK